MSIHGYVVDHTVGNDRRFAFKEAGIETVKVALAKRAGDPPINLYWHGHARLHVLTTFFEGNFPYAAKSLFGALVFRDQDRIQPHAENLEALVEQIPTDAQFVRLEHVTSIGSRSVSPDFIVWGRVDQFEEQHDVEGGDSHSFFMGVSGAESHIKSIDNNIARLISETHPSGIECETALGSVRALLKSVHVPIGRTALG